MSLPSQPIFKYFIAMPMNALISLDQKTGWYYIALSLPK